MYEFFSFVISVNQMPDLPAINYIKPLDLSLDSRFQELESILEFNIKENNYPMTPPKLWNNFKYKYFY